MSGQGLSCLIHNLFWAGRGEKTAGVRVKARDLASLMPPFKSFKRERAQKLRRC